MKLVSSPEQIIAEDLGIIPNEVIEFRNRHDLRGMSVLQFGFAGDLTTNPHHPSNITEQQIAYTGTHDNNTAVGWFEDATDEERANVQSLALPNETIQETLMRLAKDSNARISVYPLQDFLGLGPKTRMNIPGQKGKNWRWKVTWQQLDR